MSIDPIVEELHRLREEQMASFNFDSQAFFRDLKEQEKLSKVPLQSPPTSPSSPEARKARLARLAR